jgi:hypothetical protein
VAAVIVLLFLRGKLMAETSNMKYVRSVLSLMEGICDSLSVVELRLPLATVTARGQQKNRNSDGNNKAGNDDDNDNTS